MLHFIALTDIEYEDAIMPRAWRPNKKADNARLHCPPIAFICFI